MTETGNTVITTQEFGRIFSDFKPRFVVIANAYVRDRSLAEDIVNDSFLSFWENRERIPSDANITAYIYRTVCNNCINHLKSRQTKLDIQHQIHTTAYRMTQHRISTMESCDPDKLFTDEISDILRRQTARMPELTRNVFFASRMEEMTYKEIAERYDIPVRRVTAEIQKALEMLRISLRDYLAVVIAILLCK